MDPRAEHRQEIEALALRRLPVAILVLVLFIGGAFPIELTYYPEHLGTYAAVYVVELLLCALAWMAARRRPERAQAIAATWAALMTVCVAGYYPLADADATLAMAALICLVAAMPAIMPFGLRHQAAVGSVGVTALITILVLGSPSSLPRPYLFIAFLAVALVSSIGSHAAARFRWEAFLREAHLRQAHDHLRTALVRAESAAEMRSRLVANVSHELRTPLNVIVGYTDMLVDAADAATIAETVPRIRSYALSLEALVTELLDLSRLAAGKVDLHMEEIDVPTLIAEVAASTRLLRRGAPLSVQVECRVTSYRSDRMRLLQILHNLTTNAVKFTAEGSITIRAYPIGPHVAFEVEDTGCGIPGAKHEAIFNAFEQIAPAGGQGIGLGLALVRQLSDILGGTVTVASTEGVGSRFTVTLPADARVTNAADVPSDHTAVAATA
jgi:signal transduction histidine kinase